MRTVRTVGRWLFGAVIFTAAVVPAAAAQRNAQGWWEESPTAQRVWRPDAGTHAFAAARGAADTVATPSEARTARQRRYDFARTMSYVGGAIGAILMLPRGKESWVPGLHLGVGFFLGAFTGAVAGGMVGSLFIHDNDDQASSRLSERECDPYRSAICGGTSRC